MAETTVDIKTLFKAGAHFGHQRSRTDARSAKYIYAFKNKIAVIDLVKTQKLIEDALVFVEKTAKQGGTFIFVGTKLQAKEFVKKAAVETKMPYIIERWPGGLLTNYEMVTKSIKKMVKTTEDLAENKLDHLKKAERLKIEKDLIKSENIFGGLRELSRMPEAIIVVDATKEDIVIKEAKVKGIPVVALCDTNCNPSTIDYPIVTNDDSRAAIELIIGMIAETIKDNFQAKVEAKTEERLEEKLASARRAEPSGRSQVKPTSTKR